MRAILFKEGVHFEAYTLERHGRNEVREFLDRVDDKSVRAHVKGFVVRIERLCNMGPAGLTGAMYDCWNERKGRICELRKPPWRISYFQIEGESKIILVTVFRKKGQKAPREYARALGYFNSFMQNPVWED